MKLMLAMAVLLSAGQVVACSCSPQFEAPACELAAELPVVFLGTVVAAEPDPAWPEVSKLRIYRLKVDRPFKGLKPGESTVLLNPDNFTSCKRRYDIGKQYLIFAERPDTQPNVLISGACSGSRLANRSRSDIEWLEKHLQRQTRTELFGAVLQEVSSFHRPTSDEWAPVPGAKVTARSGSRVLTQTAAPDGSFRFKFIPPGHWTITASKSLFAASQPVLETDVKPGACAERFVELKPPTRLQGMVLDYRGRPAADVMVKLARRNSEKGWSHTSLMRTDAQGRFAFYGIATGDYLLGYEIWGKQPAYDSAVPSTWYPSVPVRDKAEVLHLDADSQLTGVTLRLLRPNAPRRIRVRVVGPSGLTPGSNLLQISANDQLVRNLGGTGAGHKPAAHNGTLTFTGYEDREYIISAQYWVDDLGGPVPHDQQRIAIAKPVRIPAGKGPVSVNLILQQPVLADGIE